MDHCCWSLSNSFLEVSFHAQVDRARAIPIPSAHEPITGSSANEEEGRPVSCPKRRKLGHWAGVKSAVLWLDRHLVHRPPSVDVPLASWIQAFKSIGQNACNLESCCILSEGGSLPASAIAALLRETPELKKLQVRNLLLEGTQQDLLDLQNVLQHQCASLKDFFYNGPVTNVQSNSRRRPPASNSNNNHSPLQVADAHILAKPNLKRLSMIGLPLRSDEKTPKNATSFYSSLRQCPDLEMLRLDVEPNALKMISQIVANCPRLRRLSLGIQRTNKQHTEAPPNNEEVQAFSELTHALMKSKVLHLELCIDSPMICSTRIQNLWMDLFRQNYSCKCFSVKIFDNKNKGQAVELPDLHPARGWYSEVQRLLDLNAHKRLPVLSSFAYDISTIHSWIDLLQELSTPPPSKKKKKKDESTLDQEDILTGIYLFLHDHSETLCKVALNRQTIVTRSRRPEGLSEAGTRVWLACMHGFKSTAVEVQSELVPRLTRELGDQCHVQAKLVHLFLSLEKREHELNEFWDFFSETKQKNASDWTALDMRRWRLTRWLDRFSMATLHWLAKMISGGILGHMKSMDSLSDTWKSHEENETALTNSIVRVHDVMTRVGMHF